MTLKVSANECYATNFATDENMAYGCGGVLEAPGTQREITLKVGANECYATNFATDENMAYGCGSVLEVPEDHPYATVNSNDAYISGDGTADEHYEAIPN